MINVLLVEQWATGGTARYASYLASTLSGDSLQAAVTLAVPHEYPYVPQGYDMVRIGNRVGAPDRSPVKNFYFLVADSLKAERDLVTLVRENRPDVLHVLGTWLVSRQLVRTARSLAIPLVVTVHDLPLTSGHRTRLINRQWRPRFMEADHIFVHGQWTAAQLNGRTPKTGPKISVVPFGPFSYGPPSKPPAQLRKQFGLPPDRTVVLFFGSLRKNKGLSTLIRALAMAKSEEFHLFVVANRPAQSEPPASVYQDEADRLGLSDRVTWLIEYVDDAIVPDVFTAVDILALPYDRSFAAQSAVMAIALAYAVPVVSSDVGDLGPLVRAGGMGAVAEPESPSSLLDALRSVGDPGRFSETIRAVRHRCSWKRVAKETEIVYRSLVERSPRNAAR